MSLRDRFKYKFNLYRIEKAITWFLIRRLTYNPCRMHIPIITDSPAWIKISKSKGMKVFGFNYDDYVKFLVTEYNSLGNNEVDSEYLVTRMIKGGLIPKGLNVEDEFLHRLNQVLFSNVYKNSAK